MNSTIDGGEQSVSAETVSISDDGSRCEHVFWGADSS